MKITNLIIALELLLSFTNAVFSQPAFTRITDLSNPAVTELFESTGACWIDFNNDGYLDLFVSNDGPNNFMYINTGQLNYGFIKVITGSVVKDGGNHWTDRI